MKEFYHAGDTNKVEGLSEFLKGIIEEPLAIVDDEYGTDREIFSDDGGYVVLVESKEDFNILEERHNILIDNSDDASIFEYNDKIITEGGDEYASLLFLLSNDYGVVVFVPIELIPEGSTFLNFDSFRKEGE
jgi:hypothetical protein